MIEDADGLIGTGFIGTPALLPALTKLGFDDLAEKLFLNRKVPGWLYQVERGATTIWERWDALAPDGTIYDPDMNSYNHYAYGAVCQWLFENIAGLAPSATKPGFDVVEIAPQFLAQLSPVSAWHQCRHGRIQVDWTLKNNRAVYKLELPDGSVGLLKPQTKFHVTHVDGRKTKLTSAGLRLQSGRHEIIFDVKQETKSKGRKKR